MKEKHSTLKVALTIFYVVAFVTSNLLAAKQFAIGNLTMTCAICVFPITYILSDLFSEVYGYKWSRITCYLAFLSNAFMVILLKLSVFTPSPSYWDGQEAYTYVYNAVPRVFIGSLLAYVLGDLVNDLIFSKLKQKHLNEIKGFGFRAIVSSLLGEVVDSAVFIPIAFYGLMPNNVLITMGITQVLLKVAYEIVILPVNCAITKRINEYENK